MLTVPHADSGLNAASHVLVAERSVPQHAPSFDEATALLAVDARIAQRLAQVHRDGTVAMYIAVGGIVIDELYQGDLAAFRRRSRKAVNLRMLSARPDIRFSPAVLSRAVTVYALHADVDLTQYPPVSIERLLEVARLPDDQRAVMLAALHESPRPAPAAPPVVTAHPAAKLLGVPDRIKRTLRFIQRTDIPADLRRSRIDEALRHIDGLRAELERLRALS
jgi:hypothetical protein